MLIVPNVVRCINGTILSFLDIIYVLLTKDNQISNNVIIPAIGKFFQHK